MPVANPDGYDYTFTAGNRLWRKNLRDNNGDGQITAGDGVDLNRNFSYRWGYDNEGSSPDPSSETYRGPAPNSEPETKALDRLFRRIGFEFFVNYHSAAELLLYGVGWQVSTPTPDDEIYKAMAGDDANPAVPGYDPDISAELYTTNGETDGHMAGALRHAGLHPGDVDLRDRLGVRPQRRMAAGGLRQRLHLPRRRGADPGRVRQEHPVRVGGRPVGARSGRPGFGRRSVARRTSSSTRSTSRTARGSRWPRSPGGR